MIFDENKDLNSQRKHNNSNVIFNTSASSYSYVPAYQQLNPKKRSLSVQRPPTLVSNSPKLQAAAAAAGKNSSLLSPRNIITDT